MPFVTVLLGTACSVKLISSCLVKVGAFVPRVLLAAWEPTSGPLSGQALHGVESAQHRTVRQVRANVRVCGSTRRQEGICRGFDFAWHALWLLCCPTASTTEWGIGMWRNHRLRIYLKVLPLPLDFNFLLLLLCDWLLFFFLAIYMGVFGCYTFFSQPS